VGLGGTAGGNSCRDVAQSEREGLLVVAYVSPQACQHREAAAYLTAERGIIMTAVY